MKKTIKFVFGMMATIIIFGCTTEADYDYSQYEEEIERLKEDNSSKDRENTDLKTRLSELEKENAEKDENNSDLTSKNNELSSSVDSLSKEKEDLTNQVNNLTKENTDLNTKIFELSSESRQWMIKYYETVGEHDKTLITLNDVDTQLGKLRMEIVKVRTKIYDFQNNTVSQETVSSELSNSIADLKSLDTTIAEINDTTNNIVSGYNSIFTDISNKIHTVDYGGINFLTPEDKSDMLTLMEIIKIEIKNYLDDHINALVSSVSSIVNASSNNIINAESALSDLTDLVNEVQTHLTTVREELVTAEKGGTN